MANLQVKESFTMALVSLRSNKLRTFLTLLGIIIGVLTIIAVVSVIQGLNNYVYTKMSFFGANDFSVQKFSMIGTSLKDFREQMKRKDITLVERDLIRANCPACRLVGASTSTSATVKYGSQSLKETEVRGVTYLDHEIGSVVELTSGRHLQSQDETNSRAVGVIGSDVAEKVFGALDPLGRWLKVGSRNFQVIGVGKKKGKILGFSQDNYVRIPITTFMKVYGSRRSISVNIHTDSQEEMAQAQDEVRTVLRSWRKRGYNDPDDFSFATSETFIQFYKTATSGIYFAMIAVSSIALIVGGIVIMNIMFVSVSERTGKRSASAWPSGPGGATSSTSSSSSPRSSPRSGGSSASCSASSSPGSSPPRRPCPRASSPYRSSWPSSCPGRSACSSASIRPTGRPSSTRSRP